MSHYDYGYTPTPPPPERPGIITRVGSQISHLLGRQRGATSPTTHIPDSTYDPTLDDWYTQTPSRAQTNEPRSWFGEEPPIPPTTQPSVPPTYPDELGGEWYIETPSSQTTLSPEAKSSGAQPEKIGKIGLIEHLRSGVLRRKRPIGALLLAASVGITGTGIATHHQSGNTPAEVSVSQDVGPYIFPSTTEEAESQMEEFANKRLCSSSTIEHAAAVYQAVFLEKLPEDINSLSVVAEEVSNSLEALDNPDNFYPLPKKFTNLEKDAQKDNPKIPISTYKKFIKNYLGDMKLEGHDGIKLIYDWNENSKLKPNRGRPLKGTKENDKLRGVIVGIAKAYSNMTKDLIKKTGVNKIFFADTFNQNEAAFVAVEGFFGARWTDGSITYNVPAFYRSNIIEQVQSTTHHEATGHSFPINSAGTKLTCLLNSFEAANPKKIKYGQNTYDELKKDGKYKGVGTIETNNGLEFLASNKKTPPAVFAEPYGGSSPYEDSATIIERAGVQVYRKTIFTGNPGDDESNSIFNKKLSLFIGSLPKKSKEYYTLVLVGTRVLKIAESLEPSQGEQPTKETQDKFYKLAKLLGGKYYVRPAGTPQQ